VARVAQSGARNTCLDNHYPTGKGACHKPLAPCETALSTAYFYA
jgi:hypothetical protein